MPPSLSSSVGGWLATNFTEEGDKLLLSYKTPQLDGTLKGIGIDLCLQHQHS